MFRPSRSCRPPHLNIACAGRALPERCVPDGDLAAWLLAQNDAPARATTNGGPESRSRYVKSAGER